MDGKASLLMRYKKIKKIMKTNQLAIDLIKHFEGLHDGDLKIIGLQPKMCPASIWTEGYGRTMRVKGKFLKGSENRELAFKLATIITELEAEKALKEDLKTFENIVINKVQRAITANQFSALVSHTYNTGGSTTLFGLVNNNSSDAVIRKWFETKYITGGGIPLRGLRLRRKAEADLYFKV
jgi:lysozyme